MCFSWRAFLANISLIFDVIDLLLSELTAWNAVPRFTSLTHDVLAIGNIFAKATAITFSSIRVVALGAKSLRVFEPVAFINGLNHFKLFLAKVAFDALFTGKLAGLFHETRLHVWLQAGFVHALVTNLALMVVGCGVCRLFTLFACAAEQAMPHESLDEIRVQIHALSVNHGITLGALKRVISLGHIGNSLYANLALSWIYCHSGD